MNEKIITNKIKCNKCGKIIESKYTHDFVTCKCGTCSVDGGKSYLKITFINSPNDFTKLSKVIKGKQIDLN